MKNDKSEMISFGAGVNSVAMTIMLVNKGWHGPIVFADTGSEHPGTYCYLEYFKDNFLIPHNLKLTWLKPGSEYHSKKTSIPLEEYCHKYHIIPLLATRWCSTEWKRKPINHWADSQGHKIQLLGISASEPQRMRDDPTIRYPLVEDDITRGECYRIIQQASLEIPPRSSCFFCPGQRIAEWRNLYFEHRDLYKRAIALEENASKYHQKNATFDSRGISLRQHAKKRWQGQIQMDLSEWMPCICQL